MARYFFHIFDDQAWTDDEGQSAIDLEGAEEIALNSARELACEQIRRGYLNLDNYIIVADGSGTELSRVVFRQAFVVQRERLADETGRRPFGDLRD